MDLVITRKIVHKGKDFMTSTGINDLVNKQSGKVVFGTSQIQITRFSTNANGTLFFIDGNRIGNPSGIHNGVYETRFVQFLDLIFDNKIL